MVEIRAFIGMTLGAFLFWQSMDKVHVWIALRQDEKREQEEKELQIRQMRKEMLQQAKHNDSLA